jgi:C-terminal processing protease CtpA/Prc
MGQGRSSPRPTTREEQMAESTDTRDRTATSNPSDLVRAAVEALMTQFFEPLAVDELLSDAWAGATAALLRAGRSEVPSPPNFPSDPQAAYAVHYEAFPMLERLADGQLSLDELACAALNELLNRRRDVHTVLLVPRGRFWPFEDDPNSPTGWASRGFGMTLTDTPPLTVIDVLAGGPAQRGGVRRGQAILAINGKPTAHLRRPQAMARLDWRPGAVNALTVCAPDTQSMDLQLQSELVPMPRTQLLPGPIGLLRMDGFASTDAETTALRAVFEDFERAGVRGWIIDMRWNGGGPSIQLSRLLIDKGQLFSRIRHNEVYLSDGTQLPMRQDIDLDGTALPFQRPLVILIGPGSTSGAESFAGPMQAYGRATLVGHLSEISPFGVRLGALSRGDAAHLDSVRRNGHHGDK